MKHYSTQRSFIISYRAAERARDARIADILSASSAGETPALPVGGYKATAARPPPYMAPGLPGAAARKHCHAL